MTAQIEQQSFDIEAYLKNHEAKELVRFITCGSVDDGKSTLIGRLLHDSKALYEDQLASVKQESKKSGTTGGEIDLALLVDGLQSEREQGITIDVAYRYFSTEKRKFIIADTPGHEQYTRNMATGASTADLAIILIDARRGVLTQTRRHSFIVTLLGIRHVVVAINKMDLVNYDEAVYESIKTEYGKLAAELGVEDVHFIPLSALAGENVVSRSEALGWYHGPALLDLLESINVKPASGTGDFRLPVQYVNRPHLDFRGFAGTIASGSIQPGEKITVWPSGKSGTVRSIVTYDGELAKAFAPMAVTLTLEEEIDISRGDVIAKADTPPQQADTLDVNLVWMDETPLKLGRSYYIKRGATLLSGEFETIHYVKDVNTLEEKGADQMELNGIGFVRLALNAPIAFDPYTTNHETGSFVVIDRQSDNTVAAGMIVRAAEGKTESQSTGHDAFEVELNALIRKHFPHWEAKAVF